MSPRTSPCSRRRLFTTIQTCPLCRWPAGPVETEAGIAAAFLFSFFFLPEFACLHLSRSLPTCSKEGRRRPMSWPHFPTRLRPLPLQPGRRPSIFLKKGSPSRYVAFRFFHRTLSFGVAVAACPPSFVTVAASLCRVVIVVVGCRCDSDRRCGSDRRRFRARRHSSGHRTA